MTVLKHGSHEDQAGGSEHDSHAAAVATISMDPTAAEATDDGTGEEQKPQNGGEGPSSSSDNNRVVAEPQQSGQKGSVHAPDRVRGGNAGLKTKAQEADNSRNASGEFGSSSGSNSLDDGNCSNTAEGGKEVQDGGSGNQQVEKQQSQNTQQQAAPPPFENRGAKAPGGASENRQSKHSGVGGEEQERELQKQQEQQEGGDPMQGGRPVLKKPDKVEPCPRCDSYDTKFCYYNNYNIKQPRHFCKNCQRYWTAGGTLRNVPVGAGRRKNKHKSMRLGPGSGSDSELIIPSSSGGEEYLVRNNSIRSTNPPMGAPVFKAPSSAGQGFQGRFTTNQAAPMYDSPNDKSGVTNARRDGTSADELQSNEQFRGPQYAFNGPEYARGGAQALPETNRPTKRLKRTSPEGEGLGVPVAQYGRGARETSECASSPNDLMMSREGTNFANEVLLPSDPAKAPPSQNLWAQQPTSSPQARGGEAFGGAVNDSFRWNGGANVAATPTGGYAAAAPWGGMWNQPWPYTMPMNGWNASTGGGVVSPTNNNFASTPQNGNWSMESNWGGGQNAANVAGAAAAWANANVWAGLAAAGNAAAWAPPWAAWSMFGAGPAAAAIAPNAQPSPVLGKHRREEGGEGETRDDGVWVPKIVRTEAVRGSAPQMQWQQQLAGSGEYVGMMKDNEGTGGGQEGGPLNLL